MRPPPGARFAGSVAETAKLVTDTAQPIIGKALANGVPSLATAPAPVAFAPKGEFTMLVGYAKAIARAGNDGPQLEVN